MGKIILSLISFLLLPGVSGAEEQVLKLRTSHNPGHMRIVLEGPVSSIDYAVVNQKGQNIIVTFPGDDVSIQAEKTAVPFRQTDKDRIMFSPGGFSGIKVLTLRDPVRLVIDVFQEGQKVENKKEDEGTRHAAALQKYAGGLVVIDPGHGGFESGTVKGDYAEKNVVLDIARKLGALVEKGPLKSSLTRTGDLFMSMGERVRSAAGMETDIFISLHIGNHKDMIIYMPVVTESAPEDIRPYLYIKGQGAYLKKTVALLNAVKEAAAGDFGSDMVTVRPLPYSILSRIDAAALMVELPSFDYVEYTDDFKLKVASSINKGIYLYEESEAKQQD
ncbi:MAG: hypothetical protein C4526_04915 [Nitrospiraceae bacterium]|nr:MAG: hypothetical protein C4526_04915 [Nitrospiraceae bacterium]